MSGTISRRALNFLRNNWPTNAIMTPIIQSPNSDSQKKKKMEKIKLDGTRMLTNAIIKNSA